MSADEIDTIEQIININKTKRIPEETTLETIKEMILNGADVNVQIQGSSTAVMTAAACGYFNIVSYLIESGADLTLKNRWKEDIKACAKLSGNKDIIKLVNSKLKNKQDPDAIVKKFFRPKKGTQAEYTFIPSKEFKRSHKSKHSDVGYFLDDDQILMFSTSKHSTGKFKNSSYIVDEGAVEINSEDWEELNEKKALSLIKNEKSYTYEMHNIIEEYLND